jgi:isoleucyl-tRNA synthetase
MTKGSKEDKKENEVNLKSAASLQEEQVLDFWVKNKIFKKSLEKDSPKGEYVFYDGPPFATGTPHYGHLLAGTIKDVIPRYKTMRGYHVPRRWGWDCHGLPIENLIQNELGLKTKKDIETLGVAKFNRAARDSVFRYNREWRKVVPRSGRWVDMDDMYTTMDSTFTESVWWGFKNLHEKNLVYESFRVMLISPPLETPLSNFEINQGYKDITDISAYVKFKLEKEDDTYILAWTTTPWTLPGNVALAVGEDIDYVKVKIEKEILILAKSRLETLKDRKYEIVGEIKGKDLEGLKYIPVFDYYLEDKNLENRENGWKIYLADFVTTEDGTGVVHIAPAFGEDDLNLGKKYNLPFVQHVNIDGTIKPEVKDFAGLEVKPKEDPQSTDVEVIKYLAKNNTLFEKEKIVHSYPHCWRTDAPLLNYAMSSWFVKVEGFNDKFKSLNNTVDWVPDYVGEKRFGNWLANAADWNVSRSRYWGTPVPIWRSEDKTEISFIGSISELKSKIKSSNTWYVMRHGESEHNVNKILNQDNTFPSPLTEKGRKEVEETALKIKKLGITKVFVSPLMRTQQTAEIIKNKLGLDESIFVTDERLKEGQSGELNNSPKSEYKKLFTCNLDKFTISPKGGETLKDMRKRVGDFIYEKDEELKNEKILIISHEYPIWMLSSIEKGLNDIQASKIKSETDDFIETSGLRELDFSPLPHNETYEIELHRPWIDEITWEQNGKKMKRVTEVFDTWYDSGSMPFAQNHFPFEKDRADIKSGLISNFVKSKGFPADFIAEGLDQTRGWFYTLMILGGHLFNQSPFKSVIVNGLVLAEDGKKMSKSLNNYPEVDYIFDRYGADALRFCMMCSPMVRAEDYNFSEKAVDEMHKKLVSRLLNVLSFYEMYSNNNSGQKEISRPESKNLLDKWVISNLDKLLEEVTLNLEGHELDKSSRAILSFIDDLSTWYVRRSRERLKDDSNKEDKEFAISTLGYVLTEYSKILAPFTPFLAEFIYQKVSGFNFEDGSKSVHLLNWSETNKAEEEILKDMQEARDIVSLALLARTKAGIKVKQPLALLKIKPITKALNQEFCSIIGEEVNVKDIAFDATMPDSVWIDTNITPDLRDEGLVREFIRLVQDQRKNLNLSPDDAVELIVSSDENLKRIIDKHSDKISKIAKVSNLIFGDVLGEEFKIDDITVSLQIRKV